MLRRLPEPIISFPDYYDQCSQHVPASPRPTPDSQLWNHNHSKITQTEVANDRNHLKIDSFIYEPLYFFRGEPFFISSPIKEWGVILHKPAHTLPPVSMAILVNPDCGGHLKRANFFKKKGSIFGEKGQHFWGKRVIFGEKGQFLEKKGNIF